MSRVYSARVRGGVIVPEGVTLPDGMSVTIAVNDEQGGNAQALADVGAAWLVRQPELTGAALGERLTALLADPAALVRAGHAAAGLARSDAAARLADLVLTHARVSS